MDEDGKFLIVETEGLEFEKSFADFDEEVVIVVHLFNDFDNVGNELITDSVMSEDGCDDGYFGGCIEFEGGVVAFEFFDVDCAIFFLAVVKTHLKLSCI